MMDLKTLSGKVVPPIGVGTFPLRGCVVSDVIYKAIEVGYRLIDTSDDYMNEDGIGIGVQSAIQSGLIKRENLFIQTKISDNDSFEIDFLKGIFFNKYSSFMQSHTVDEVVRYKVETSLRDLRTDYIDSLLIHTPLGDYNESIWEALLKLKKEGKVRYIGVSNFCKRHIDKLVEQTNVCPSINEIYISPIGTKQSQVEYAYEKNIQLMIYSPLMDIASHRITTEMLYPLIQKYEKSLAQIILRWHIERGCIPLPKTSNITRLVENFNIFDFTLTSEDVEFISSLNRDYQSLVESKISIKY